MNTILQAMARILELEENYFVKQNRDKAHAFANVPSMPYTLLVNLETAWR
jgi:hypothetical protein